MNPIAHDTRRADASAERAALREFQRKVVRVTLIVLLCIAGLACWVWVSDGPARTAFDWLGGSIMALVALKLVLGVLPAEVCVRIVRRKFEPSPDVLAIVRPYYWFLGFMLTTPGGIHRSDTWGIDLAAFGVFAAYAYIVMRRRKLAQGKRS